MRKRPWPLLTNSKHPLPTVSCLFGVILTSPPQFFLLFFCRRVVKESRQKVAKNAPKKKTGTNAPYFPARRSSRLQKKKASDEGLADIREEDCSHRNPRDEPQGGGDLGNSAPQRVSKGCQRGMSVDEVRVQPHILLSPLDDNDDDDYDEGRVPDQKLASSPVSRF